MDMEDAEKMTHIAGFTSLYKNGIPFSCSQAFTFVVKFSTRAAMEF